MQQFSKYKSLRIAWAGYGREFWEDLNSFLLFSCPVLTSSGPCSDCTNPSQRHRGGRAPKLPVLASRRLLKKSHSLVFPAGLFSSELSCLAQQIPALFPRSRWLSWFYFAHCDGKRRVRGVSRSSVSQFPTPWCLVLSPKAVSASQTGCILK